MKYLFLILTTVFAVACNNTDKGTATAATTANTAAASGLDASFENLMTQYYSLQDALVKSDTALANNAAQKIIIAADSLKLGELGQADSTNILMTTAQQYSGTIKAEAQGLLGESGLEPKRKEFQMITSNLFELARTIRYDNRKIYLINCPMAFDGEGADWLNGSTEIRNPYFGDKMLTCGSVKDSLVLK